MRIWLDRTRMAAYNITSQDVEAALMSQNLEVPAGRIESSEREFTVLTQTDLNNPEQFEDIVLRNENGYLVRLKDVASVEIGPEEERVIARFSGRSAVALGVVKQSTANPLELDSWERMETNPLFTTNNTGNAFGPGHNSFFKSLNGDEDWILYHANPQPGQGCGGNRTMRMQKFKWDSNNFPVFGIPEGLHKDLIKPSGE